MEHLSDQKIELSPLAIKHIKDSAKWGKFLAIVGFVTVGLVLLVAMVMAFVLPGINLEEFEGMQQGTNPALSGMGPVMGIVYLFIAVLYFFPVFYLYNYSIKAINAIRSADSELLTSAFDNMRRLYKFIGILTIITIALYAIIFIGVFIGGVMGAAFM